MCIRCSGVATTALRVLPSDVLARARQCMALISPGTTTGTMPCQPRRADGHPPQHMPLVWGCGRKASHAGTMLECGAAAVGPLSRTNGTLRHHRDRSCLLVPWRRHRMRAGAGVKSSSAAARSHWLLSCDRLTHRSRAGHCWKGSCGSARARRAARTSGRGRRPHQAVQATARGLSADAEALVASIVSTPVAASKDAGALRPPTVAVTDADRPGAPRTRIVP